MTEFNVDFELCSVLFLWMLFVISKLRKRLEGYQSPVFQIYLYLVMASNFLNVVTTYALQYHDTLPAFWNWGLNVLFLSIQMILPGVFIMYIYRKLPEVTDIERKLVKTTVIPALLGVLLVLSSPLTQLVFYFDEEGYHHGLMHIYLYINFIFYSITALFLAVRWRKKVGWKEFPLLFTMIGVNVVAVLVQFAVPDIMLAGVGAAMSVFIMYFTCESNVSFIDPVTGSLNRAALTDRMKTDYGRYETADIYAVAPDNFKLINEMYGLDGGNAILHVLSARLSKAFGDKNVFRFGGDTFAVIVTDQREKDPGEEIREIVGQQFSIGDVEVLLSACLGLVHVKNHPLNELMSAVEYAVAEAKALGKGEFFEVEENAAKAMARKKAIESTMLQHIREGHFEVHYQLIYDIRRKGFYSMEALARLKVPEYGYVSPEEFIKMAEKNGSITQLGLIVLEECCRFISESNLHELGIDFIEVNLSMVQCIQPDIHRDVLRIMQKYQVPTHMINFEVTESVAASSEELLLRNMERFTEQRIHFSLDDYGSGYSNINYLVDLPFSIVKIDKYVVWAAMKNETSRIILENTIRTFKNIGLRVVAEGVEDQAMVDMICAMGTDYIQGFFYAKPVPKDQIVDRLKDEMKRREEEDHVEEESGSEGSV